VTTSAHLSATPKGNDAHGRPVYTLTAQSPARGSSRSRTARRRRRPRPSRSRSGSPFRFPS
jgi:hypothetical protein